MWSGRWAAKLLSLSLAVVPSLGLAADSSRLISQLGATKGICVVITSAQSDLSSELTANSELTIYVQASDAAVVASLQKAAAERGLLGTRIYVEQVSHAHLYLADNLAAGAVVAGEVAQPEGSSPSAPAFAISAFRIKDGSPMWREVLRTAPVAWGLVIDRVGRAIVTLVDGTTVCLGEIV